MIEIISYIFVYLAEVFISLLYFDNKYERKRRIKTVILYAIITTTILYLINFLNMPYINLLAFLVLNFLLIKISYNASFVSAIFSSIILCVFMVSTELVMLFILYLLNITTSVFQSNGDLIILQAVLTKTTYVLFVFIAAKIASKEETRKSYFKTLLLCLLPISSIMLIVINIDINVLYDIDDDLKLLFLTGSVLVLVSNVIVFIFNEFTIKTNIRYTQLLLEQQQVMETSKYYDLLKVQNSNQRVLMHDINKHLKSINQFTTVSDDKNECILKIQNYLNNIDKAFSISNQVDYTNSPQLNLITYRYKELCTKNDIDFHISIRNCDISFMSSPDITALFDNLLENAFEASLNSENKYINFSIYVRNTNYLIVHIKNSYLTTPTIKNNNFVTSKSSKDVHGIGTRSIKKVLKKYNGIANITFDEDIKEFSAIITFNLYEVSKKVEVESV